MKKAVIFDLDGTLSDSIESMKYCGDLMLNQFGMAPFPIERYKYFVGDGAANLVKRALLASGDEELTKFDEAYSLYRDIFAANCMYNVKPYAGIEELIDELKGRDILIAVLSNKPHLEAIKVVEDLFGKDTFDVICGQKEGVPIKPDPSGVFDICSELEITVDDILYVGDTGTDMRTGKSAGAFTIGVLWGFRDEKELMENDADAIVCKPSDILDYLN